MIIALVSFAVIDVGRLRLLEQFRVRAENGRELLDALYRETLAVASQLVARRNLGDPRREAAMIKFRNELLEVETSPGVDRGWSGLNAALIELSEALKGSMPASPR